MQVAFNRSGARSFFITARNARACAGTGKTKTGRLWIYVRDDRPAGRAAAPAVWFAYSPDRRGEHPQQASG